MNHSDFFFCCFLCIPTFPIERLLRGHMLGRKTLDKNVFKKTHHIVMATAAGRSGDHYLQSFQHFL